MHTADNDSIFSWLHHLRLIFPPTSVVLIGAGSGTGYWAQLLERWNVQTAVLVEADEGQFQQLKRHVIQRDGWQFLHEVIGPKSGETSFYQNSLGTESGLFGPEQLCAVWPNLKARNVQNRTALSLSDLINTADVKPNWLFIDCMPASSILAGAECDLELVDVVIVRVALTDQLSAEASLTAVTDLLQSRGYRFLVEEVSRHPAVGHALYARDIQKNTTLLQQNATELADLFRKLQAEQSEKDSLCKKVAKRQQQVEQLTEELEQARAKQNTGQQGIGKVKDQNAGMDEFISDLTPFFYGRSITYVDAGACFGAVFLKLYQAEGVKIREAHLYEPNPDNFAKLFENIKDCTTQSLHTYQIGLADTNASKRFSKALTMTKAIEGHLESDSATNIFHATCLPLDELSSSFTDRHIDLLKIDVEGSEIAVLTGAHQLLTDQKIDVIYIEVGFNIDGTQQVYFGEVDALLQKYHYRCFKIYEQVNEWMRDSPLLRRCNIAYMSTKFAESNPYKMSIELQSLRSQLQKTAKQR